METRGTFRRWHGLRASKYKEERHAPGGRNAHGWQRPHGIPARKCRRSPGNRQTKVGGRFAKEERRPGCYFRRTRRRFDRGGSLSRRRAALYQGRPADRRVSVRSAVWHKTARLAKRIARRAARGKLRP